MSDFNMHAEDPMFGWSKVFMVTVLNNGLSQVVLAPIYEKGDTLDLLFSME